MVAHLSHDDTSGVVPTSTPDSSYSSEESTKGQSSLKESDSNQRRRRDDEPRIFALVVGIDQYASKDVPRLFGCNNDVQDFENLLTDEFGVPRKNIARLSDGMATRFAIIETFKKHLLDNKNVQYGDTIVFYFSGHGACAPAPTDRPTERNQIEMLCPHDYAPSQGVHGIPDYVLDALIRALIAKKGDNVLSILDCCHSGGMDREQSPTGERVRGIHSHPNAAPLPRELDQDILSSPPYVRAPMAALEKPYRARATYVTLSACSSLQKAKECSCSFIPATGLPPLTQDRGIFSVNLISMLRVLGKDGIKGWSYSHLMSELVRRGRFSESLPRLASQNPECKGMHKGRAFFGTGGTIDIPDTFILNKVGGTWHVQAGTMHGVVAGTTFHLTQTAIQCMGEDVTLSATTVSALDCQVASPHSLPDSLVNLRVAISRWGDATYFTRVSIRGAKPNSLQAAPVDGLYYQEVPDNGPHDLTVNASKSGSVSRIERTDQLLTTFCNSARVRDFDTGSGLPVTRVLNSVSRFNFHLYRLNTAKGMDDCLKVTVLFHVVERVLAEGSRYRVHPGMDSAAHYEDILHSAATFIAKYRPSDAFHLSRVRVGDGSHLTFPKAVKEIVLKPIDEHFYGFTLVNDSDVDLFPYVFYFYPDTCAITPVYISESESVAPLPSKSSLPIGHGGSPSEPMSFKSSHTQTRFLKVFVTTRYVEFNIEQPPMFSPPAGSAPAILNPPSKDARLTSIPKLDGWNAWIYALTPKAMKKHA